MEVMEAMEEEEAPEVQEAPEDRPALIRRKSTILTLIRTVTRNLATAPSRTTAPPERQEDLDALERLDTSVPQAALDLLDPRAMKEARNSFGRTLLAKSSKLEVWDTI